MNDSRDNSTRSTEPMNPADFPDPDVAFDLAKRIFRRLAFAAGMTLICWGLGRAPELAWGGFLLGISIPLGPQSTTKNPVADEMKPPQTE